MALRPFSPPIMINGTATTIARNVRPIATSLKFLRRCRCTGPQRLLVETRHALVTFGQGNKLFLADDVFDAPKRLVAGPLEDFAENCIGWVLSVHPHDFGGERQSLGLIGLERFHGIALRNECIG